MYPSSFFPYNRYLNVPLQELKSEPQRTGSILSAMIFSGKHWLRGFRNGYKGVNTNEQNHRKRDRALYTGKNCY